MARMNDALPVEDVPAASDGTQGLKGALSAVMSEAVGSDPGRGHPESVRELMLGQNVMSRFSAYRVDQSQCDSSKTMKSASHILGDHFESPRRWVCEWPFVPQRAAVPEYSYPPAQFDD